jgi:hypothetical protein
MNRIGELMADINVDDYVKTLSVDQADYVEDGTLNVQIEDNGHLGRLIINNPSDSPEPLNLAVLGKEGSHYTTDLRFDEGANVKLVAFTAWEGLTTEARPTVFVENGSTLEFTPEFLSSGQVPFDIRVNGGSKLIYDSTGTSIDQSSSLIQLTVVSPGSEIQVIGANSYSFVDGKLTFKNSEGEIVGNFNAPWIDGNMTLEGDTLTFACYLKGTHIATPDGEVQVEYLKAGDKILTASGGVATVKWLGYRTLYKSRIADKDAKRALPILFKKGCIADNVPHRDLFMSPGHHVSFDGNLVAAMNLVNGKSIVQQFEMKSFQYFHIELEQFDILLAEGVPAESYVDTGNRNMFQNAHEVAMNPDFGPAKGRPNIPGITVVRKGPLLEAIRAKLLERANWMQVPEARERVG